MTKEILLLPIFIPLLAASLVFFIPKRLRLARETITFLAALVNFLLAIALFKQNLTYTFPWLGGSFEFSLRLYHFSAFIILAAAFFAVAIVFYSFSFLKEKNYAKQFNAYLLLSLALVNGAVLADNLLVMLFFWEGLLVTIFAMIAIGGKFAFRTAAKALIIVGASDLCLMSGIALVGFLAGTLTISKINLPLNLLGTVAFILLMIGAISKAGAMPFHSWIPDAAIDAPLPFMAFFPAAIEKLLGIYFLARISLDIFRLNPGSWVSTLLMIIGAITIILAVMMALVQKDYKRLLSYHAISQVGYMILGIGTAVPAGIVGGLFHMLNNAMYKSGLFLGAGAVEARAGTTDLEKLGGIGRKMPITFLCFIVTALSISGVPPFNGFFSKELVYDGALERGLIFYLVALIGSFFTAASFLKLGHAAFLGKISQQNKDIKEAPPAMLAPMLLIAFGCILFGIYNSLPVNNFIQPILGENLRGGNFSGMPKNFTLVIITLIVLALAFLNHLFGVKQKGSGLHAVDHIRYAPVLSGIYRRAEQGLFDPYNICIKLAGLFARVSWWLDRKIDWIYEKFIARLISSFSRQLSLVHTGNYSVYLAWSLLGVLLVSIFLLSSI